MELPDLTPAELHRVAGEVLDLLEEHQNPEVGAREGIIVLAMCIAALVNMLSHTQKKSREKGVKIVSSLIGKFVDDWADHKPKGVE